MMGTSLTIGLDGRHLTGPDDEHVAAVERGLAWLASVQEGSDVGDCGGPRGARHTLREADSPLAPALSQREGEKRQARNCSIAPV